MTWYDPHWAHTEIKELEYSIGFLLFAALALRSARVPRDAEHPHREVAG